jgi:uncharacterized membrane protein YedE/YeeE
MTIAWNLFTPWTALAGGLMIGLAASLLILLDGRIAGISGVLGGMIARPSRDTLWRGAFLGGLIVAPLLFPMVASATPVVIDTSSVMLAIAGLLVGLGTRFGSGCTSGHGVCGLSRRSLRSLVATLCFMATGFATVYVVRHLVGV